MHIELSFEREIICLSSGDHFKTPNSLECPKDLPINSKSGSIKNKISPNSFPIAINLPLLEISIQVKF